MRGHGDLTAERDGALGVPSASSTQKSTLQRASKGPSRSAPPAPAALAAAASALSTRTYVLHAVPLGICDSGAEPIPATSRPATRAT